MLVLPILTCENIKRFSVNMDTVLFFIQIIKNSLKASIKVPQRAKYLSFEVLYVNVKTQFFPEKSIT